MEPQEIARIAGSILTFIGGMASLILRLYKNRADNTDNDNSGTDEDKDNVDRNAHHPPMQVQVEESNKAVATVGRAMEILEQQRDELQERVRELENERRGHPKGDERHGQDESEGD